LAPYIEKFAEKTDASFVPHVDYQADHCHRRYSKVVSSVVSNEVRCVRLRRMTLSLVNDLTKAY